MSHFQPSLPVFHEFVIQNIGEVCGILALFLLIFYHLLLHPDCSEKIDEENDDVEVDDVDMDVEDNEYDDMAFVERLDQVDEILSKQLELMQKLNRIEEMSEQIEAEKAKGNIIDRLNVIEHKKLVYKFNISDFNNFCRSVYKKIKSGKQSRIYNL
jgi:hypothetical protein